MTDQPPNDAGAGHPYEQPPPPPGHTEDPNVPANLRHSIPPTPVGWTDQEWRESYLGKPTPKVTLGRSLSVGNGWLLPAVVFAVFVIVIVMAIFVIK